MCRLRSAAKIRITTIQRKNAKTAHYCCLRQNFVTGEKEQAERKFNFQLGLLSGLT
jgi:hypothetical protein